MPNNSGNVNGGLPENQGRSRGRGERPESWSWYPVVGVVGGLAGAAIVEMFGHLSAPQSWTTVGLIATLTGVLAALLGVIIAFVVAFQWIIFDRRVDQRVEEHRIRLETSLQRHVRQHVQAIGELAIAWTQPVYERERVAQRILQFAPDTPNLAPLMAWTYLQQIPSYEYQPEYRPLRPIITPEMIAKTRNEELENASRWATAALETRQYHDPGFPEWVMTLVCAWQKQPHRVLEYFPKAMSGGLVNKEDLQEDTETWQVLVSSTHGDEATVDAVLRGLGFERPDRQQVQDHCEGFDAWQRPAFWAVERQSGTARKVILEKSSIDGGDKFSVFGYDDRIPSCTTLPALLDRIYEVYIPIRIIPGDFRTYVVTPVGG